MHQSPQRRPTSVAVLARRLALAVALGTGCVAGESQPAAAPATPPARDGTARMADTLAAIAARGMADPLGNPFLNRERAAALRARALWQGGADALNLRHRMADELLRAGETREAITELESLMRDAGDTGDDVTPRRKPVRDLLAIAYLRLGEQENCRANPAANVCILPLAGGARHVQQEGARGAIARYAQLLRHFPDDLGSRWLLNVAWMAVGGYPDSVPPRFRIPGLAPRANDPFPRYRNVANDVGLGLTGVAGGLSIADFDGDGLLDVFATSWEPGGAVRLLMADGKGGYVDRSAQSGLKGITGGLNTVHADYDNDGDVDVLVLRGAWLGEAGLFPNSLLRNRGDGTFEDVTFATGLASYHPTQSAAWADYDLDGHLDLFVGNERNSATGPSHRSELFHNDGNGTFTEVALASGIDLDAFVKGVTWGDVDNDGKPDLYVSVFQGENRLYMNCGRAADGRWRFEERAAAAGVTRPVASFPTWFWDFDDDGWDDLLVLSYDLNAPLHETVAAEYLGLPLQTVRDGQTIANEPSRLYRNRGDGTFEDATERVGLARRAIFAMGSNFGDLDDDGWLDVHVGTGNPDLRSIVPNRMFRNVGGRRLEEVTLPGGFGHLQKGHATAFADLDRDGDEDVYMVVGGAYQGDRATSVLYENPGRPGHHWLALELEGRTANRSAIGARVEVDVTQAGGATRTLHRTVGTGGSFGSGPLQVHVGLGRATAVRAVRVQWPDSARTRTSYAGLAMDRVYRVVQGAAPVLLERPRVPFRTSSPTDAHAHH
ncbi:CRTAC1 family protein [Roseisolibacter agri]|uniref:ASPIC/UnbV domain-containing protein n=1 Tax=Roseisolibacter agri TaxID=2014610 RepID=A0AA37Q373_9BACT|nr:CRTAC1 family protein [Roseisolibacter agri]GLC25759.1 hypothetical protein rosag_22720 [Roseisolibacter agri]